MNTVNGLELLPNLRVAAGEREYLVHEMLTQLGDGHSTKFYELVASKVPASHIIEVLAQIRADGAAFPPKLFTYRMHQYALGQLRGTIGQSPRAAQATVPR
jgi:hypothetical protein